MMRIQHLPMVFALIVACALTACTAGAEGPVSNRVEMTVTEKGFAPQNLRVKKGEPVTLIITRKTDTTCATEVTVEGTDIKTALPLNKPVTVTFTPDKSGKLKYGCAMNKMVGGIITVL